MSTKQSCNLENLYFEKTGHIVKKHLHLKSLNAFYKIFKFANFHNFTLKKKAVEL